jgi:hypothetical protein
VHSCRFVEGESGYLRRAIVGDEPGAPEKKSGVAVGIFFAPAQVGLCNIFQDRVRYASASRVLS